MHENECKMKGDQGREGDKACSGAHTESGEASCPGMKERAFT